MKTILSLTLAAALTLGLFTGCGCAANVSTDPNGMITEEATTRPSIMPTPTATHETTQPHATMPTVTGSDPTEENALPNSGGGSNGTTGGTGSGTGESTTPTDTTMDARHRNRNSAR